MQRRESKLYDQSYLDSAEAPFVGRGMLFNRFSMVPKRVRFENDPEPLPSPSPTPGDPTPGDPTPPPKPKEKMFSQAHLDRLVAASRRELQQKHQDDVLRLQKSAGLSEEEKKHLAERSKELEDALLTEKEQAKKAVEGIKKQLSESRDKERQRADANWSLYTGSMISTEIATAAAKYKAFNPKQIEAIVRPLCVLEDEKNEKLEKTGRHVVKVNTTRKNEDGKTEKVTTTVDQFVASMGESDESYNLFLSARPGGMGVRPGKKGTGPNLKDMSAKDKIREGLRNKKE